ncbi:MAG: hypothetical protein KIS92_15010 [Planctomycetota bacterium]|nr:hypothetical protein [Planctomycetota bacterium]
MDLLLAGSLLAVLSAAAFALALRMYRAPGRMRVLLGAAVSFALICLYSLGDKEPPWLQRLLPWSGLLVLGAWFTLPAAFLAGLAWRRVPGRAWRKALSCAALLVSAAYVAAMPLLGSAPRVANCWKEGVCLQTADSSCSAACAATILRDHGISASEAEMAELCLTRERGTTFFGLYRGLKLKTAGTPWDVETFTARVEDARDPAFGPAILVVGIPRTGALDPRYERNWGWVPGVQHAVVFYEINRDGKPVMGDPSVGRECWDMAGLHELWLGKGIRLVPRR